MIALCLVVVVSALNKAWCVNCFSCSTCNTKLTLKWVLCRHPFSHLSCSFCQSLSVSVCAYSNKLCPSGVCALLCFSAVHVVFSSCCYLNFTSPRCSSFPFKNTLYFPPAFLCLCSFICLSLTGLQWWPPRDKFVEVDLKPVCKHCYDRLPEELKRRLAKRERDTRERKKKTAAVCL